MAGNTFGKLFRITTFGESHGKAIGVVIDGCPAGIAFNRQLLQQEMERRKPGQSKITSRRKEDDDVEVLSGVFEDITTGTPISLLIRNKDQRSKDYDALKDVFRPSHADFTWQKKYGIRDHRGGGRSSARETAARVAAGAVAKMLLSKYKISIQAYVKQVGKVMLSIPYTELDFENVENNPVRCPHPEIAEKMLHAIETARKEGNSLGGIVGCVIKNTPAGLGEPVFDKLHARLAYAMMGINAARGFEIGAGFASIAMKGSEHNDEFINREGITSTKTNHSGGVQGGISNSEDIYFNVAFKPVATIALEQNSVDRLGNAVSVRGKGRHDPCVLPRAVPIVEAMSALVMADFILLQRRDVI